MREAVVASAMLLFSSGGTAQPFVSDHGAIPFVRDSVPYVEPLSGGLNAPLHQFHDLDGDGDLDLFIFDSDFHAERLFFRNTGSSSAPSFSLEPGGGFRGASFSFWFRFADHDADGVTDLLTDDGANGVRVWRNDHTPADPVWTVSTAVLLDTAGVPVFAGFGGLPGFADLDGDGLPDFLSGNAADGSFNYYRNAGSTGAPAYALVTTRLSDITITSDTCTKGPGVAGGAAAAVRRAGGEAGGKGLHGLGAVALHDGDGDGDQDLFYGDLFSHGLFHLRNDGGPFGPELACAENAWPPGGGLQTQGFNQASFADLDGDGDADLFVGVLNARTRHSFWHFADTGAPGSPAYAQVTRDFLPTFDAGQNSRPAVADLDADGDLDLVVGNNEGQLWFLRNIGSPLSPVFALEDTAFAGITGDFSYAPAFADLDDDGDPDLILGRFDGRVILFANQGPGGFVPFDTLLTGQYAVPAAADVDGDGDADLVIGLGNGTLTLLPNVGTPLAFVAGTPETGYLGIDAGDNARPAFFRNPSTGRPDLCVAPAAGDTAPGGRSIILHFRNTGSSSGPRFEPGVPDFAPGVPFEAAPVFADLDGDGDEDLLAGTGKGGVVYYRNDEGTGVDNRVDAPASFRLGPNYPNPFNAGTVIPVSLAGAFQVGAEIFDVSGRRVGRIAPVRLGPGDHRLTWDGEGNPTGVYYCRVTAGGNTATLTLLLIR